MGKTAFPTLTKNVQVTIYANIPFDNKYKHHSLISSLFKYGGNVIYGRPSLQYPTACEEFIDRRDFSKTGYPYYYPRYTFSDTNFNFNFTNGLIGTLTLELTDVQTNCNYMKVSVTNEDNDVINYYYFITGITQVNYQTYSLSLECDVLMTYQDEFLTGMKDVPVFTARKHSHRYTDNGIYPFSLDFKTGEDAFAGVKPSIVETLENLEMSNQYIEKISDVRWLYVCGEFDQNTSGDYSVTEINGKQYPLCMMALPLGVNYQVLDENNNLIVSVTKDKINECVREYLVSNGQMHGAKFSYFPPFTSPSSECCNFDINTNTLTLKASSHQTTVVPSMITITLAVIGNTTFMFMYNMATGAFANDKYVRALNNGGIHITKAGVTTFRYDDVSCLVLKNESRPDVTDARYLEPKLLFSPFKKYVLNSAYAGDGWEFYPELYYGEFASSHDAHYQFETLVSCYIGDDNYYTYLLPVTEYEDDYAYGGYKLNKIGLCSVVNYVMPVGTNALDVFNATNKASFTQSKIASGVSSGLSIIGGIASIGVGATLGVSNGALTPVGASMIASGSMAIAGGIAGEVETIKSTNAKYEDLKNTPNSINISGANFTFDDNLITGQPSTPYVVVYSVSSIVKENANDFFYNYGYQVSRECYFNTNLDFNATSRESDNNLFGRTIFNYIQLNEDITNKINADIPLIAKQKLSIIFNQGITLWSFFGFRGLWSVIAPTSDYYVDKWFMKCELDNTEYNIHKYTE